MSLTRSPPVRSPTSKRSGAWLSTSRAFSLVVSRISAGALAAATTWFAYNLPVARGYVAGVLIVCGALQLLFPTVWLITVPVLLPVFDLTLWSGRLYINEFDLLVLTTAAAHFLTAPAGQQFPKFVGTGGVMVALLGISLIVSMLIGALPLPSPDANQLGSYLSNYNALRVGKSIIWAMLLMAPLQRSLSQNNVRTASFIVMGISIGLALVGLVVLWERGVLLAIAQSRGHFYAARYSILGALLDFTSEYRATALFSEMHTGGEAIDTYLALASPIAAAGALGLRHPALRLFCVVALCLGVYAVVATFSRGLYFGLGGGMATVFILSAIGRKGQLGSRHAALRAIAATVIAIAALAEAYSHGGFDALCYGLALGGSCLAAAHRGGGRWRWPAATGFGVSTAVGCYALFHAFQLSRYNVIDPQTALLLGGSCAVGLAAAAALLGGRVIPKEKRLSAAVAFLSFSVVAVIAIPATVGTRMVERFSTSSADADVRWMHWEEALRLMGPDWEDYAFGMGLGSFPALYFRRGMGPETRASYRYLADATQTWLELGSGDFNLTQKVPVKPAAKYNLSLRTRAKEPDGRVTVKLCPKLILFSDRYTPDCLEFTFKSEPPGDWVVQGISFDSGSLGKNAPLDWPITLMLHNDSGEHVIDITDIHLTDSLGEAVVNGNFAAGGDRWILISDFEHLAWHIKNLYLEVFFESGAGGLVVFLFAMSAALTNAIRAVRRQGLIGAGIAGSLVAFALVGLTGSLLDNPRPALLFFILLIWALQPVRPNLSPLAIEPR